MGIYKTFYSDLDKWITISNRWWNVKLGEFFSNIEAGYDAAIQANDVLQNAPSDVGGSFTMNITRTRLDELYRRRMLLKSLSDGIHYEAAELIDVPFTLGLENIIENAYDLDPKDFKVIKGKILGFINKQETLQSLMSDTFDYSMLKIAFIKKANDLNYDKPSRDMKKTIKAAKFWDKEFDKADKIQVVAREFIDTNASVWKELTAEERRELLTDYCIKIGLIMDENETQDSSRGLKVGKNVEWISESFSKNSDAYGLTYSMFFDGIVFLNDKFGESEPRYFDIYNAVNIVTHETRHHFQQVSYTEFKRYDMPIDIVIDLKSKSESYWRKPIEIDARAFAGLVQ